MVNFEIVLERKDLLKTLKEANEYSMKINGSDGPGMILYGSEKKLEIQDDFLMANIDNGSWIAVMSEDFTPEMMAFLFEVNIELATEEVLQALLKAAGIR